MVNKDQRIVHAAPFMIIIIICQLCVVLRTFKKGNLFHFVAGDMDDANYEDENDNTSVFISNGREGLKNYSAM